MNRFPHTHTKENRRNALFLEIIYHCIFSLCRYIYLNGCYAIYFFRAVSEIIEIVITSCVFDCRHYIFKDIPSLNLLLRTNKSKP